MMIHNINYKLILNKKLIKQLKKIKNKMVVSEGL